MRTLTTIARVGYPMMELGETEVSETTRGDDGEDDLQRQTREGNQLQVVAFASRGELGARASHLQLMRASLGDLQPGQNLANEYAGGKVESTFSGQLTQGSMVVLLRDYERYVQCAVGGETARLLPRSTTLEASEMYVTGEGVRVAVAVSEFSQEEEVGLAISGENGQIWIINPAAKKEGFLPVRPPAGIKERSGHFPKENLPDQEQEQQQQHRVAKEPSTSSEKRSDMQDPPPSSSSSSSTSHKRTNPQPSASPPIYPTSSPPPAPAQSETGHQGAGHRPSEPLTHSEHPNTEHCSLPQQKELLQGDKNKEVRVGEREVEMEEEEKEEVEAGEEDDEEVKEEREKEQEEEGEGEGVEEVVVEEEEEEEEGEREKEQEEKEEEEEEEMVVEEKEEDLSSEKLLDCDFVGQSEEDEEDTVEEEEDETEEGEEEEETEEGEEEEDTEGGEEEEETEEEEEEDTEEEEGGVKQDPTLFQYNRSATGKPYIYTKLEDLEPGQQKVNVFGVVIDFQRPFQTKGRDFCSIVNIIDESLPQRTNIKFTFFHANQDRHPRVSRLGDVVSFHRVNIKLFSDGLQGIGQSFSSSLSFSGILGSKIKPLTGSVSYTFTVEDCKRVKELRLWYARLTQMRNQFLRELKDIRVDQVSSDVVCQVLSVSAREGVSDAHVAVLHIWDGTQLPLRSLNLDLTNFETRHVSDTDVMACINSFAWSVVVYGQELVDCVTKLTPGQFVCLQNLRVKVHTNQFNCFKDKFDAVELCLQPSKRRVTKINVLSHEPIEVHELRKKLAKCRRGLSSRFRLLPPDIVPTPVTETRVPQDQVPVPLCSLEGLKSSPSKFLCVVKVLGIEPGSVEQLVLLRCPACKTKKEITADSTTPNSPCPDCLSRSKTRKRQKQPTLKPTYFFRLKLADETGNLVAHVSGRQAKTFLSSCPPTLFFKQPQQRASLLEKLYKLTGNNDPFDVDSVRYRRPWISVCLVSMIVSGRATGSERDQQQQVSYHLFDTILK